MNNTFYIVTYSFEDMEYAEKYNNYEDAKKFAQNLKEDDNIQFILIEKAIIDSKGYYEQEPEIVFLEYYCYKH